MKKLHLFSHPLRKLFVILGLIVLPLSFFIAHSHDKKAFADTAPLVTITAGSLHVRETPSLDGKIINLVHKDETYRVLSTQNNWDQIELLDQSTGWVSAQYVTPSKGETQILVTSKVNGLNVHQSADLSSKIISHLSPGTTYQELKVNGDLIEIQSPGGPGWVTSRLVTVHQVLQTVSTLTQSKDTATAAHSTPSKKISIQSNNSTGSDVLKGKTIVLDAGHGGKDNGTTSVSGTHEKTLTLETAEKVQQMLSAAGANVVMTRTSDTYSSLQDRVNLSISDHADAFISFHYNYSPVSLINGATSFYYNKARDQALASDLLDGILKKTGQHSRCTRFDNLYVLRNNTQPSTLIELGFVSNTNEDSLVESSTFQDEVAQGVYNGLIDYFSNK